MVADRSAGAIPMKITKEKSDQNRAALVSAASRLFREKGIDGVGVAEISKAAGLTHGALYAHFPSKGALAVEAMALGVAQAKDKLFEDAVDGAPDLDAFLDFYLDPAQRDDYGGGCGQRDRAAGYGAGGSGDALLPRLGRTVRSPLARPAAGRRRQAAGDGT